MCVCRYWGVVYSFKYAVLRAVSWFTLVNSLDKFKVHNEQLDVRQSSNWRLNKYRRWRSLHEWKIDMYNYNHHKYIIYNYPVYKLGSDTIIVDQKVDKNRQMLNGFILCSHYRIMFYKTILLQNALFYNGCWLRVNKIGRDDKIID